MKNFVVVATIHIEPGSMATYLPELMKNARAAVRDEVGCHHFDVLREAGVDDRVMVYEIYEDEAAFEAHQQTPHYLGMRKAVGHLIRKVDSKAMSLVA